MPVFEYKGLDEDGRRTRGVITAEGAVAARMRLGMDRIYPTEIRQVDDAEESPDSRAWLSRLRGWRSVSPLEVSAVLRQMATLVSAGLPLVDCLQGVIEQSENQGLKGILIRIKERVIEGRSLSQAMSAHPSVFGSIHVNMIRAGETGGVLDVVLARLADYSEKRRRLGKKIESAMVYPIFLILMSGIILVFLMSFVMPKVVGVFAGMKLALPWSTRVLIWLTEAAARFWWLSLLTPVLLWAAFSMVLRTGAGRRLWDHVRLRAPLLGPLHRKAVISRFTGTLSVLLKSGIPLVDSLEIARSSMGNLILEQRIQESARMIGEGGDLATPLRKGGWFPPMVIQLIRAGEKSGDLEGMLSKAAEIYEEEVEGHVATLTSLLEPLIILVMGLVVGFLVLAILLPIFDMTSGIK
ncbi:MAG: type II secretion system F family protein [Deltaproteobacteria bacterium]|nr:type II secretion system F family protein [Deltaproteobacteria bacterium]